MYFTLILNSSDVDMGLYTKRFFQKNDINADVTDLSRRRITKGDTDSQISQNINPENY